MTWSLMKHQSSREVRSQYSDLVPFSGGMSWKPRHRVK